jgi:hypothetical protein
LHTPRPASSPRVGRCDLSNWILWARRASAWYVVSACIGRFVFRSFSAAHLTMSCWILRSPVSRRDANLNPPRQKSTVIFENLCFCLATED